MTTQLTKLITKLRRLNASYERNCARRFKVPFNRDRAKSRTLQDAANRLCGQMARTERKIIDALLAEEAK